MKIFGIGLMAFIGLLTEQFVKAGILGCVLYAILVAIGVCIFCISGRVKS